MIYIKGKVASIWGRSFCYFLHLYGFRISPLKRLLYMQAIHVMPILLISCCWQSQDTVNEDLDLLEIHSLGYAFM